jgi:hypothetical protein
VVAPAAHARATTGSSAHDRVLDLRRLLHGTDVLYGRRPAMLDPQRGDPVGEFDLPCWPRAGRLAGPAWCRVGLDTGGHLRVDVGEPCPGGLELAGVLEGLGAAIAGLVERRRQTPVADRNRDGARHIGNRRRN